MRLAPLLALSFLFVSACQTSDEVPMSADYAPTTRSSTTPTTPLASRRDVTRGVDYVFYPGEPMRHAFQDPNVRIAAKADGDEVRNAYPERYAITKVPPAGIRAMVEWEPMEAVVMQVPDYISNYEGVMGTINGIGANAIPVGEVWYVVESNGMQGVIKDGLSDAGISNATINAKTRFLTTSLESLWFIDSGPLPIIDPASDTYAFADFRYYSDRAWDDGVPTLLGRRLTQMGEPNNTETYRMPVSSEGGTFQATSDGVCFTGARQLYNMSCLDGGCNADILYLPLSQLQTHPYTLELEASWGPYAGCEDVIVTYSITDDGTGHIDMYMKVASDDLVIMGEYEAPYALDVAEYNAARLDANAAFIASYVKPNGGSFDVGRIVMPGHRNSSDGTVPFTYINSTMINGRNLWPATTYLDWTESRAQAQSQWEELMPGYEHIWIDATEISFWSGAVHCITRTIPDKNPGLWIGDGQCQGTSCQAPDGGYDDACYPTNYTASPVCWGPDWLCSCNNCDVCGPPNSGGGEDPCDGITYEGCCDGTTLKYCESGQLKGGSCGNQGCGWDAGSGYYDCGESGADPSGTFPLSCDDDAPCEPSCGGKECGGDGCGGSCGSCEAGEACTSSGLCDVICVPDCEDKDCGDDGCGNSCGTCTNGTVCEDSQCVEPPSACGDLTYEGCCDGLVLNWCQDGQPLTQTCDKECGWNTQYGYLCGETGEDPSGEYPLACAPECVPDCAGLACGDDGCGGSCGTCAAGADCEEGECVPGVCVPDCAGKDCGGDGCGGSCGTCPDGEGCNSAGLCEPLCVPNCADKECGTDGCGGSCGTCADDQNCELGICVGGCGDMTYEGCCDDKQLSWCEGGQIQTLNCGSSCGWSASNAYYDCGQSGPDPDGVFPLSCDDLTCEPKCEDKECGDDGCGGICGACGVGETCSVDQLCKPGSCEPACTDKECGDDGCGGSCGTCGDNEFCTDAGLCEAGACTPDCTDKVCGDDGCGGSCGLCGPGETCTASGDCKVAPCTPSCDDKECGADGCGGSCGSCDPGTVCIAGQCTGGDCTPDCSGKECGTDGCGGWCGTCPDDELCTADGQCELSQCTPDCSGQVCGDDGCGGSCGACPAGQACTPGGQCVSDCTPSCDGKVCGDDGCGGWCGSCEPGEYCSAEGECVEGACVPDCDGKACGDDGCGQPCGECGAGETCSPQYECVPAACVPDCELKACGDDGCGGICGECPDGQVCGKEFRCEIAPCEADCAGKTCGDDGCGGLCGDCAEGEECSKEGACVGSVTCTPACDGLSCGDDGCGGVGGVCEGETTCDDGACVAPTPGDDPPVVDPGNVDPGNVDPGTGTTDPTVGGGEGEVGTEDEGGVAAEGCQGGDLPARGWPLWALLLTVLALRRRGAWV